MSFYFIPLDFRLLQQQLALQLQLQLVQMFLV